MIFDTSIWVGLASGQVSSQAVLRAAGDEQVYISAVSLGELSFGVESCSDPATRMLRLRSLRSLEQRPVLDVTSLTGSAFGILAAFMKQSGRSPRTRVLRIPVRDLWIAAQALENNYALLTANLRGFEGFPGLRVSCP
jgi:predicted nucleic acid-binding protein